MNTPDLPDDPRKQMESEFGPPSAITFHNNPADPASGQPVTGPEPATLLTPDRPPTVSRQVRRNIERQREKQQKPGGPLAAEPRHGDLRILPCSNPDHPTHVHIWSDPHSEWLPCDDASPIPAAIIAALAATPEGLGSDEEE